jgi:hypothetical protein
MGHQKWAKMVPSTWREGRWAIRSLLWVRKDVEAEQVPIESPDLTAAVIRLPERLIFMASVYVEGGDAEALRDTWSSLRKAITKVRRDTGAVVEVAIVGDFNRHDQLWGGNDVRSNTGFLTCSGVVGRGHAAKSVETNHTTQEAE